MQDKATKRRRNILIVIIATIIVGVGLAIVIALHRDNSDDSNGRIDPNTQNIYTGEDNSATCPDGLCSIDGSRLYATQVFGTENLADQLLEKLSERRYVGDGLSLLNRDIAVSIAIYGERHSDKKYDTVTIIPSSLSFKSDSRLKGELSLEQTNIVPFQINIVTGDNGIRRGYIIIDESFYYIGGFTEIDSITYGSQSIGQPSYKSPTLVASMEDKERAIHHISSLGYKIPDLTVTFESYRSPFE